MPKKPTPKPSVLLQMALDLFGPKGEHWIKEAKVKAYEAGFVDTASFSKHQRKNLSEAIKYAERMTEEEMREVITDELASAVNDGKGADEVIKLVKELDERFIETPAHQAWCSIGAICKINTPNESEAGRWLAKAIEDDSYEDPADEYEYGDNGSDTIIGFNDAIKTTWPRVKEKFQRAIKLAKAAGR